MGEIIDVANQEDLEFLHIGLELRSCGASNDYDRRRVDAKERFRILHDLRTAQNGIWGFKDPTLIDYLPEVIQFVKNPRLLCVMRGPVAIAMREEMAGNSFDASMRLTVARQSRIVAFADSCDFPVLFISYEKLLLRPWETFGRISRFVTGSVDDSLQEAVERYVIPERPTAAIENVDYESLGLDFAPSARAQTHFDKGVAGGRQKAASWVVADPRPSTTAMTSDAQLE
jgi:hypothetical protein